MFGCFEGEFGKLPCSTTPFCFGASIVHDVNRGSAVFGLEGVLSVPRNNRLRTGMENMGASANAGVFVFPPTYYMPLPYRKVACCPLTSV